MMHSPNLCHLKHSASSNSATVELATINMVSGSPHRQPAATPAWNTLQSGQQFPVIEHGACWVLQATLKELQTTLKVAKSKEAASLPKEAKQTAIPAAVDLEAGVSTDERESLMQQQQQQQERLVLESQLQYNDALIDERDEGIQDIQRNIQDIQEMFQVQWRDLLSCLTRPAGTEGHDHVRHIMLCYCAEPQTAAASGTGRLALLTLYSLLQDHCCCRASIVTACAYILTGCLKRAGHGSLGA